MAIIADDLAGEATVHPDYSGRGMYGERCFGISGRYLTAIGVLEVLEDVFGVDSPKARDFMHRVQTDSLGLGTIFYFPGYSVEPSPDLEDA
jgi:hypothetical protein